MKEICVLNKGDNLKKICYSLGISASNSTINHVRDFNYITINDGSDDVVVVRNYHPMQIKTIENDDSVLDIYASGYEIVGGNNQNYGKKVVVSKTAGVRYSVAPLETLEDIAYKFGVSKTAIMESNALRTEKLFVGQILII